MKTRITALLSVLFALATSQGAWACAACYNPAGSAKMTQAATVGIGAMVIIMFVMLGAVAAFGRHLAWRAKHPLPDYNELLGDDNTAGTDTNPNGPENKS